MAKSTVRASTFLAALGMLAIRGTSAAEIPKYDHVVVVIMENQAASDIVGNPAAPYINGLIGQGAYFSQSSALTHPSQPNYIALFSGSTHGVFNDSCPQNLGNVENLGHQMLAADLSFVGYSEDLPSMGYTGCASGDYARKHNPWVDFSNIPADSNLPWTAFPADYSLLPELSFVIPNLCNDMHDCPIATGDAWLRDHLDSYVQWAKTNNSLFELTWDEDNFTPVNRIVTVFAGADVVTGTYETPINHYSVLRTIEGIFDLTCLGNAATAPAITEIWGDGETIFSDGFDQAFDVCTVAD
jgi:acid phosphatase